METTFATDVSFEGQLMFIDLSDGRAIRMPLSWFPVLEEATDDQRAHLAISTDGQQLFWPELDEDMSVTALLHVLARETMH
ncbi:DUF2442 domain-containing protein [Burkholderia pseudomallei]|uniref:DUF2442 domain-containing protein n=1 Tax=Burkholderia pseudomallei TaxID=28450 RepID=UPI00193DFE5A|nr:DUF2442 domain-containing protein [Burkholderia pseudomallei]QRM23544.1 DUF2442 domain-containing protein [Burkholderia pseudomallei]